MITTNEDMSTECQHLRDQIHKIWAEILEVAVTRSIDQQTLDNHMNASNHLWAAMEALNEAQHRLIYAEYPPVGNKEEE